VAQVDALSLDRLDDERGHVARRQRPFQGIEIPEGHRVDAPDERPEALAELRVAVQRQRPQP